MRTAPRLVAALLVLIASVGGSDRPARGAESGGSEGLPERIQDFFLLDSVYPQDAGEWQLGLAPSWSSGPDADVAEAIAEVETGLTDRLQLQLEAPFLHRSGSEGEDGSGIGDLSLGARWAVAREADPVAISVGAEVTLPTGDEQEELGEGTTRGGPLVIVARPWGPAQIHAFLAAALGGGGGWEAGLATVMPVGRWRWTAELVGEGGNETVAEAAVGALRHLAEGREAGLAVAAGLTSQSPDWKLLARIVTSFGG